MSKSDSPPAPAARRQLVRVTTERLRERIFQHDPHMQIGSLPELARALGVGIVTVQQAARILEHEGLLEVRRGPGGGYYGRRPDAAVLERSLAAYMRTQPESWEDALDMTSLLFSELVAAAARCTDDLHRTALAAFRLQVEACDCEATCWSLENAFQDLLFLMVNRPLFELLTRVTLRFAASRPPLEVAGGAIGLDLWKDGRGRIIAAILAGDEELARFEANRSNRRVLLQWLERGDAAGRAITSP